MDPRVAWRQRYCPRVGCKAAGQSKARSRWRSENPDHFKGFANLLRVQDWRRDNPGYWRRRTRVGRYSLRGPLGDAARLCALQHVIDTHFSLVVGLLSRLTGSALQHEIADEMRRLMLLGHGIITQSVDPSDGPAQPPAGNGGASGKT